MKRVVFGLLILMALLCSCQLSNTTGETTTEELNKSCISPYDMIQRLKAVDINERYAVMMKIIIENGFQSYFDGFYDNEESKNYIQIPVTYEYILNQKDVVLMLMTKGKHVYDYLLFVKESDNWSMDCVVSVNERNAPYFNLEYTPSKEDFWLVYRKEVSGGTSVSGFDEVWVNRYGEEVLRYPSQVYTKWQTTENGLIDVSYHADRSHSLQNVTIDEFSDNYSIPPYSVQLNCYTSVSVGDYYEIGSDVLVYYWDVEEKKFAIDFDNKSQRDYYTSFLPEDTLGKEVFGENYFDYSSKYYKLYSKH